MVQIARIIGGAGTGKTTELLRLMEINIRNGIDPFQIGFVSFTRAARAEAASRAGEAFNHKATDLERSGWFRTLHSICYKQLGIGDELITDNAESKKWISEALDEPVSVASLMSEDQTELSGAFDGQPTDADRALGLWGLSRSTMEPLVDVVERVKLFDWQCPEYEDVCRIVKKYEMAKRVHGRCDFTDILGRFAGIRFSIDGHDEEGYEDGEVPDVPVWFLDEQQDTSALLDKVCRRLVEPARFAYVVLDPFQCQPAGTMVLTTTGPKPIEQLNPETDRLYSYSRKDNTVYGVDGGFKFEIASRRAPYLRIQLGGQSTFATENHKWLAKWTDKAPHRCCVYLMRKGSRFRVGWCQLFRSPDKNGSGKNTGVFHLGTRARLEMADAAWILSVHDNRTDASIAESLVATTFGLPTITFRAINGANHITEESIDCFFGALDEVEQLKRANECLLRHRRSMQFPLWVSDFKNRGIARIQEIHTCNLIPGLHSLPKHISAREKEWITVESVTQGGFGEVFSMNVESHHTYIADGFITCNSIYGFSGSSSRHAMSWGVQKEKVLPKSHRCPKNILELGEDILRQSSDYWDRKIQPNGPGGEIERIPFGCGWADEINPNDDWLLIARTNWQAKRMAGFLKDRNIPWIPTRGNGGWLECHRTRATQALIDLQAGLYVMDYDWKHIVETLPTKVSDVELLARGTKTAWKKRETSSPKVEEEQNARWVDGLTEWGATPALIERIKTGRWSHLIKNGDEHVEAFKKWGRDAVMKPKVRVGTIHSVKGSEADNVALLTTTSQKTAMTIDNSPEQADEEHRIGYVAVTRCRKRLLILDEKTPFQMLIP